MARTAAEDAGTPTLPEDAGPTLLTTGKDENLAEDQAKNIGIKAKKTSQCKMRMSTLDALSMEEVPLLVKMLVYIPVVNVFVLVFYANPSLDGIKHSLEGLLLVSALVMSFIVSLPEIVDEESFAIDRVDGTEIIKFKELSFFGIIFVFNSLASFVICFVTLGLVNQLDVKQIWRRIRYGIICGVLQLVAGLVAFFYAWLLAMDAKFLQDGSGDRLDIGYIFFGEQPFLDHKKSLFIVIVSAIFMGAVLPSMIGLVPLARAVVKGAYNVQTPEGSDQQCHGPKC